MSTQAKVSVLKQQLEHLFPGKWLSGEKRHRSLATGIAEIDAGLANGLARRRITEWSGAISSGKTTLLRMSVANWCASGWNVVYVDPANKLSPSDWAFVENGNYIVSSPHVVPQAHGKFWVIRDLLAREKYEQDVVWAVEQLVLSNVFDVIIFDAGSINIKSRIYARFKRVLERSKAALIVVRDEESHLSLTSHWGAHTQLSFGWTKPIHFQEGLNGNTVSLISEFSGTAHG